MQKIIPVHIINSFTDNGRGGNGAGVVEDSSALNDTQMQEIACKVNLSETAFITNSHQPGIDSSVRFFTPTHEIPMCGHATIAAQFLRHIFKPVMIATEGTVKWFTQLTKMGEVRIKPDSEKQTITFEQKGNGVAATLDTQQTNEAYQALGLNSEAQSKLAQIAKGPGKEAMKILFVKVDNEDIVRNGLAPDFNLITKISKENNHDGKLIGIYAYAIDEKKSTIHSRGFFPYVGVNEDPATGYAAGLLAAHLVDKNVLEPNANGSLNFTVIQGLPEQNRFGKIQVQATQGLQNKVDVQVTGATVYRELKKLLFN